jgi:hypothetical protein
MFIATSRPRYTQRRVQFTRRRLRCPHRPAAGHGDPIIMSHRMHNRNYVGESACEDSAMVIRCLLCTFAILATAASAIAGTFESGSDCSDGDFIPGDPNTVVDLSLAQTGAWDMPGDGNGVYDPDLWAVVFKYNTVNIPAGVTVAFTNHPSGAPVVWLTCGNVTIQGEVVVDGAGYYGPKMDGHPIPGPGGFAGGGGGDGMYSSGFGPGGANPISGGSYASGAMPYGNSAIVPLIGGSGGGGHPQAVPGGAGGGAILIASSGGIVFLPAGLISARGGDGDTGLCGGGSGGGIRLIANAISGPGTLTASGGVAGGGLGRIRLEAFDFSGFTGVSTPEYISSGPGPIFPASNAPVLRATAVNGVSVPPDPEAGPWSPDLHIGEQLITIDIEAMNIPISATVEVQVRPRGAYASYWIAPPLQGNLNFSTTQATIVLSVDPSEVPVEIQLKANWLQ